jgi:hypothetical protein
VFSIMETGPALEHYFLCLIGTDGSSLSSFVGAGSSMRLQQMTLRK